MASGCRRRCLVPGLGGDAGSSSCSGVWAALLPRCEERLRPPPCTEQPRNDPGARLSTAPVMFIIINCGRVGAWGWLPGHRGGL